MLNNNFKMVMLVLFLISSVNRLYVIVNKKYIYELKINVNSNAFENGTPAGDFFYVISISIILGCIIVFWKYFKSRKGKIKYSLLNIKEAVLLIIWVMTVFLISYSDFSSWDAKSYIYVKIFVSLSSLLVLYLTIISIQFFLFHFLLSKEN